MNIQAIFVEGGHGKSPFGLTDCGAVGTLNGQKVTERQFTKAIASRVLNLLSSKEELKGVLVQGVGIETETNIRRKMAFVNTVMTENKFAPNNCIGVAIHMNSSTDKDANGFEVWYQKSGRSANFALAVAKSLDQYQLVSSRGKTTLPSSVGRYGRFYIDDTLAKYIIVEAGFISNPSDAKTIWENLDREAESIAHGILEYARNLTELYLDVHRVDEGK